MVKEKAKSLGRRALVGIMIGLWVALSYLLLELEKLINSDQITERKRNRAKKKKKKNTEM